MSNDNKKEMRHFSPEPMNTGHFQVCMLQFSNPSRTVQDNWEKRKEQYLLLFGQTYRDPSYTDKIHPTLCPVYTTDSETC